MASLSDLRGQDLAQIAEYHNDVIEALASFFGNWKTLGVARYIGSTPAEMRDILATRLEETALRSALEVISAIEAAFRVDYLIRSVKRKKEPLSRDFRQLYKAKQGKVRLNEEILERWLSHHSDITGLKALVGELRGALRFRHWLAHGRYWQPARWGRKYDYDGVSILAELIFETFPLYRN
jgi:hypothetical protein